MTSELVDGGLVPEEALRLIEDHGVGTWTWELDRAQVTWSSGMSRILGVDHATTAQTLDTLEHLLHPDDRQEFRNPLLVASSGNLVDQEYRILRPSGEMRWVHSFGTLRHARDGRPERLTGVAFDVTDSRLGLQALQQREGLFDAVRTLFGVVIWSTGPEGDVIDEIEWWRRTGQRGRVDGWHRLDAVHPDDRQKVRDAWDKAVRTRSPYATSYRVEWGDEYVPVVSRAVPIIDRIGTILAWTGFTARQDGVRTFDLGVTDQSFRPLTPGQVRAARGYLGWSAEELAERAGVSFSTVRRVETPGERSVRQQSIAAIRKALEAAGIGFTYEADGRTGVSMK